MNKLSFIEDYQDEIKMQKSDDLDQIQEDEEVVE